MSQKPVANDYKVEYAKSNRAKCKLTHQKIPKGALRIGKFVQSPFDGCYPLWYSFDDFEENERKVEEFRSKCKTIHGLSNLRLEDQDRVNSLLKGDEYDDDDKMEDEGEEESEEKKEYLKENENIWNIKDKLLNNCNNKLIRQMLELNGQSTKGGQSSIIERCAHGMLFGALGKCGKNDCIENSFLYFSGGNVLCSGRTTWGKCSFKSPVAKVKTRKWKVPSDTRNDFLNEFVFKKHKKSSYVVDSTVNKEEDKMDIDSNEDRPESILEKGKPFKGMTFYFAGRLGMSQKELRELVEGLGGSVTKSETKWDEKITFFVTNEKTFENNGAKIRKAKNNDVSIVDEEFVQMVGEKEEMMTVKEMDDAKFFFFKGKSHVTNLAHGKRKRSSSTDYISDDTRKKKVPKMTLKIKGHSAVDVDVLNGENYHVLEKSKEEIYSVHLTCVDVQANVNSFYILQIVVHDKDDEDIKFFRKWGRVGTDIGSHKEVYCDDEEDAMWQFEKVYLEKTGNEWKDRANFQKRPGKFFPIKMDYGETDDDESISLKNSREYKGELPKQVQDLVKLIFDLDLMENTLKEMDIDTNKMPLGKLSKDTITNGFLVLQDLQTIIEQSEENPNVDYTDEFMKYSNKFYTFIPHTFSGSRIPLIDNLSILKEKIKMLETLRDMEVATSLMKLEKVKKGNEEHPIDQYYKKLKSNIVPIEKSSKEFKIIQDFITNTHCPTHTSYTLELLEAFKLIREGEMERFKPWIKDENRRLLWHGSRLSNWVGIISQGLRIAPPEAPVTGYMFGKGVYFADMVSKSANYCRATKDNDVGCLLIGDVALGSMYERLSSEFVTKEFMDENDYQSTWGKGKTIPNESKKYVHKIDGSTAIVGKPKTIKIPGSSLLYNEFIVYDVSQINMKYLLKVKFKFKKNSFFW